MTQYLLAPLDKDLTGLRKFLGSYQEELTVEGLVDSGSAYCVEFEGSVPQLYITLGLEPKQISIKPLVPLEF
ncbi:hypothetical protein GOV10_00755 [Candidatus Woesearchaeota archaeon]|nr:hypothetical protein [Candidatus Woesearchaeota archaeon]